MHCTHYLRKSHGVELHENPHLLPSPIDSAKILANATFFEPGGIKRKCIAAKARLRNSVATYLCRGGNNPSPVLFYFACYTLLAVACLFNV